MRSKAPLVLMEQMVMVLVFALAAALCLQAFVLADRQSRRGAALDRAVAAAQSAVEVWKGCGGDADAAAGYLGGSVEEHGLTVAYGADWGLVSGTDAAFRLTLRETDSGLAGLRTATVDVYEQRDPEPLFTLSAACQEAAS